MSVKVKRITDEDRQELEICENTIHFCLKSYKTIDKALRYEFGKALKKIREKQLYFVKHQTFKIYCQEVFNLSDVYARRLIKFYEINENFLTLSDPMGSLRLLPENERQIRELTPLDPQEQIEIWDILCKENNGKAPTGKQVKEKVEVFKQGLKNQINSPEQKTEEFPNDDSNVQEPEVFTRKNYQPAHQEPEQNPEHLPGAVKTPEKPADTVLNPKPVPELNKSIDMSLVSMNNDKLQEQILNELKLIIRTEAIAEIDALRTFFYDLSTQFESLNEKQVDGDLLGMDLHHMYSSTLKSFNQVSVFYEDFFDYIEILVRKVQSLKGAVA